MIEANNDEVICPECCHQFRAISVNVQLELKELNMGIESLHELVCWAYSKMFRYNFSNLDDALKLDAIKLLLELGE
jgi:hypothetical protein